jgi:hypothetical protein
MRPAAVLALLGLLGLAACGEEIGDECSVSTDCSSDGDRICDTSSPNGYCTVSGCDHDSCPDEAVCVRFFGAATSTLTCDPAIEDTEANVCSAAEICTVGGACVPLTAESRYCMRSCDDDGDCRSDYECRDLALMIEHGGEPVPPTDGATSEAVERFCAPRPLP